MSFSKKNFIMSDERKKQVQKVVDTLSLRKSSKRTIDNYVSSINRFLQFFHDKDIANLNEDDILYYIKQKYLKRNCSANTYNLNICAIKYFYSINFNKKFNENLLPHAKLEKKLPMTIDIEVFNKILNEEKILKHKCWLLLAYCSGLRVEEIACVQIENINSKEHTLKVLGKRKKERYTVLPDIVIKYLRLYYQQENFIKIGKKCYQRQNISKYLFEGTGNSEHVNPKTLINYFSSIKIKYNLDERISFHSLRHSFATNFIKNGGDPFTLKSMLGHASFNTTSIYIHTGRDFNNLKGVNYEEI